MGKVKKMPSLAFASLFKRNKGQNTVKEKRRRSHQINMLEGPLVKKILLFTLPLAGSSILQQLFNSTESPVNNSTSILMSGALLPTAASA